MKCTYNIDTSRVHVNLGMLRRYQGEDDEEQRRADRVVRYVGRAACLPTRYLLNNLHFSRTNPIFAVQSHAHGDKGPWS